MLFPKLHVFQIILVQDSISQVLFEKGLNIIGVPKTIDNDLSATDYTNFIKIPKNKDTLETDYTKAEP